MTVRHVFSGVMLEDYQRTLIVEMIDELDRLEADEAVLGQVVARIRGLYTAADLPDPDLRTAFEMAWVKLDHQHELRTEGWAPMGTADQRGTR